jgi:hypothetical protein
MKTAAFVVPRVVALTIILFICFAVAGGVVGLQGDAGASESAGATALTLLAVCFLNTVVVTHLILRSRWTGWRLMAVVCVVFYGVMTFMAQIETAVFVKLPPGTLPRLFLMGALIAAPFSVAAVLVLGKRKATSVEAERNTRLVMPRSEWAWKLAVIALAYVTLYFTFGYFIAWRNPAVSAYYGGVDEGSFVAQLRADFRARPWLIPFQVARAMCWTALALPVIRMMKGKWPETALSIGLLFSMGIAQLLLPNPYMPEAVRMAHLVETGSSNFIFGALVGWLLTVRQSPFTPAGERAVLPTR